MENPIKIDDFGVPLFQEPPYVHMKKYVFIDKRIDQQRASTKCYGANKQGKRTLKKKPCGLLFPPHKPLKNQRTESTERSCISPWVTSPSVDSTGWIDSHFHQKIQVLNR